MLPPLAGLLHLCNPALAGLADHEALDGVTQVQSSTRFSVKWGEGWTPEAGWVDQVLDALETAHGLQVEVLGLAEPDGMTSARYNVYVADSGVSMEGELLSLPSYIGGYAHFDPDGWPLMVISRELSAIDATRVAQGHAGPGETTATILAHEFQHSVQAAARVYTNPQHHWWREGMATWAAAQQVPEYLDTWTLAVLLREQPERAVERFDQALWEQLGTGGLSQAEWDEVGRVYGSFVLPTYLSAELDDPDLVAIWATEDGGEARPLDRLADVLVDEGLDLGDAIAEMWAALQAGRLAESETLTGLVEGLSTDGDSHNPTAWLQVASEASAPPEDRLPGRFGANIWRIDAPADPLLFSLDADTSGSAGTPVSWAASAVRCDADGCTTELLATADPSDPSWTVAADGADRIDLVLVPATETYVFDETFDYRIRATAVAQGDAASGCGCGKGGRAALLPWLIALIPAWRRKEGPC